MKQYKNDEDMDDLICACVDLELAFDTVEVDYLILLLRDMNFPNAIVDVLVLNYSSITVSIKGQATDCFQSHEESLRASH